jgi:hypothetical protein
MSPSLIIITTGLIFLALFSLSLFAFIVIRRIVIQKQEARFNRLYGHIEQDVLEAISRLSPDFSREVALKHKEQSRVLIKLLLDFGEIILGEGREQLRVIFNHSLKDRCLRDLASRRTARRLQSARLFILFLDPTDSRYLLRLLDDKPIIKLAVVSALSRIPSSETVKLIFKTFEKDNGSAVHSYFNILFGLGNRIEPLVKASLKKPQSAEKLGLLIELVGALPLHALFEEVIALAGHPDKEIRIKVARALGKLLLPESVRTLVSLASDEAWEVQAQALKSLGKLKDKETLDILTGSLFSPFWYVRYNAAYGLAEMGKEGIRRLKKVAAQPEDKYARDMSVMVLNDLIYSAEAA